MLELGTQVVNRRNPSTVGTGQTVAFRRATTGQRFNNVSISSHDLIALNLNFWIPAML